MGFFKPASDGAEEEGSSGPEGEPVDEEVRDDGGEAPAPSSEPSES